MSIKKNNTYFKENDGKVYYFDENGVKKEVPSTAFSNLQEQIDAIGKPLTYSGSKSVTEINTLEEIKIGTVYTITGEAGNITAGNVDVIQGDEIAWGGDPAQWFNIGKDKVDSWKTWSEEHGSTGTEDAVYIGKGNNVNCNITAIGDNNSGRCNFNVKILGDKNNLGTSQVWSTTIIGNENKPNTGDSDNSYKGKIFGDNNSGASNSTIVGDNNKVINGAFFKTIVGGGNTVETDNETYIIGANNKALGTSNKPSYVFGYNNSASGGFAIGVKNEVKFGSTYNDSVAIGSENKVYDYALGIGERNSAFKYGISIGTNNSSDNGGVSIGKYNTANDGGYAIGHQASATQGALAISENGGAFADNGSISIGDNSAYASCGSITLGRNGVSSKNDSYTLGSYGLYALNHSTTIGNGLSAIDAGFAIGVADSNGGGKAEGGMIITMTNRSFKGGYHDNSGNWIVEDWGIVTASDSVTCLSGKKYINDEGEIVYTGIPFTANEKWMPFAYNGGITIGRAASSNRGIAISPKWTNINTGTILGTSSNNESVAIGENVIATNGSLVLGKNGMSATDASIGIGRMGVARGASVLMSNDLVGGNKTPFSGKLWAYYDETEEKYKPFDKYDSVIYKNYQTIQNKIYNKNTSAFESLYTSYSPFYILFLNTWDGSIGCLFSGGVSWGRQYFSGYYDENNNFIKVNSQSEVPSTATLIQAFSASADKGFGCIIGNNIFTTTLTGSYTTENYTDNPYARRTIINGYILGQDTQYNYHLYESCLNRNNTNNSSLYNFLKQYKHLSGYVDENALNGMYYEDIKYDAETDTIFNTTDDIVDYWTVNGQKVYPKDISEQTFIDLDEERTYSDANSVGIGMGLSSYGNSIAINAGTEAYPHYTEYSSPMYCCSGTIGNMLTGNSNYTAYLYNSYSANKEIKSKNDIVTAFGKSIVLGADGRNISAGGNSIAIGNHDINVTGKSVGIGNNIYSLNQSIVINQKAFGNTPTAMNQSIVIGGSGSWANNNSFIFGEGNSANNNAYVFGQGNSASGRTFAFGEANYIATGRSFALGYSNYINGQTEVCTIGYRNYANGGSMQNVIMGYDNYMSVGGYALHLIGNRNSASCGSIYGSVVGNWNMLSHGNSLLAIHGDNNSAFGSLGEANILGHYNVVGGGGNRISVIGYDNGRNAPGSYGSYDGIVLGNGNNWNGNNFRCSIIGMNNKISGISYTDTSILGNDNFVSAYAENGIILGNSNYVNAYDNEYHNNGSVRNTIVGYGNTASGYASMNSVLIGNSNRVYYGQNIAIGEYNSASEQSYVIGYCNTANIDGDNLGFGINNKIGFEAISIGKYNKSFGHSILLGWNNNTNTEAYSSRWTNYAHSIMLGNNNSTTNSQGYTYQKSYPYINQKILSENEIRQINNVITELEEQRTTAYQNAANKVNEIYSLLTANGLDSVSAENYINGTLYSSGYGHSYISPYTPWDIQSYPNGISYKENGTWYTGYGESAYVKRWIYNTSSYSSYDTSDYYYKYYWLPAKQASATWSIVSSIYTAQYGSDSANRYNEVNIAIQHIDELTQAIYAKQDELSQNPITASGTTDSHNIETMSLVVGQGNSADHHNSIVIGSENHTLKVLGTNLTGDDGFTIALGIGNTVARNYDMAIGYGSVAFGGENIAIGQYIYDSNNEIYRSTSAVGLRNISLRSTVTGFNNVAVDSHLLGTGVSSTIDTSITSNYGSWHTNFEKNKLFDSIPTILGSAYSINNNNFDDIKKTIFTINNCFDRNDLRNIKNTYITAATATDNILHNVYDTVIIDNYNNEFNTYTNVISSTIQTNSYNSFNTYKNVTSADISAGSNNGSNLFYDIGGYGTRFNNRLNLTADYLCHNIVINATITGSSLEWPGISNNIFWKSYVQPYRATAYGQGQISTYGDSFSENMLIGTEAFNTVHESFSFGALASDLITPNYEGQNSTQAPILRDCTRVWNFGDNSICHAYDTFVAGLGNELNGVNKFHVLGTNNFVKLKNIDNKYTSNNGGGGFHDSIILGNVNAISTPIDDYDGYRNTRNYIIGQANSIIATSSTLYHNENSDLKIIGNDNHYAGTNSFIAGILGNGSIYKWVTDVYEDSYGNTSSYNSIIPVYYSDSIYDGKSLVDSLSSYPISGASRDMMIGSRNVISNNITDSTIIGFYNAIHQDEQEHEIKFNNSNIIGSYNLAINGSNQFNVGFNNITSGHHSTAIGEELKANAFQTILGKYNISALGTSRTTMKWNSATSAVEHLDNTGVLLAVGNGRLNLYEKWSKNAKDSYSSYNWFDESGNLIPRKNISDEQYIHRSNAMIVSADGTVSARRFVEAQPDTSLQELITLLHNKPATGSKYIIGLDEQGTLTWVPVTV